MLATRLLMENIVSNEAFISLWDTTLTSSGSSLLNQITLPLVVSGTYNFFVNWGDGNTDQILTWNEPLTTHTYIIPGQYTLTITGICTGWQFNNTGDRNKLLTISNWGCLNFGNTGANFFGCSNLTITATDVPNLDGITVFDRLFASCTALITIPNLGSWDVSNILTMVTTFSTCPSFNEQSIIYWQPLSCTSLVGVLSACTLFNAPVGNWPTSSVLDMTGALQGTAFNYPLNWDCTSCTNMSSLLASCSSFNSALNFVNSGNVTNMSGLLTNCTSFNQPVSFDTSGCQNMSNTFANCSVLNSPILINTQSMTTAAFMFNNCSALDQDFSGFNVQSLTVGILMFGNLTLSNTNYNLLLNSWSQQTVQSAVNFNAGSSQYDTSSGGVNGVTARAILTNSPNLWAITDGGESVVFITDLNGDMIIDSNGNLITTN